VGGYGTLAAYRFTGYAQPHPTDNRFGGGEGGIEILSMNGLGGRRPQYPCRACHTDALSAGTWSPLHRIRLVRGIFAEVEGVTLNAATARAVERMGEGDITRLTFSRGYIQRG